jgi:hypothetical protein
MGTTIPVHALVNVRPEKKKKELGPITSFKRERLGRREKPKTFPELTQTTIEVL